MKRAIAGVIAFLLIILLAGVIMAAIKTNQEADETITRIDSKIERCENGR